MATIRVSLYSKWTLPDLDGLSLSHTRKTAVLAVIQKFSLAIQNQIRLKMRSLSVKRAHPSESVAMFPEWVNSQLSLSNGVAPRSTELRSSSRPVSGDTASVLNKSTSPFLNADEVSSSPVSRQNRLENDTAPALAESQSPERHASIHAQPLSQPIEVQSRGWLIDPEDTVHGQSQLFVSAVETKDRNNVLNDQSQHVNIQEPHHSNGNLAPTTNGDLSQNLEGGIMSDQIASSETSRSTVTAFKCLAEPQPQSQPHLSGKAAVLGNNKSHKARRQGLGLSKSSGKDRRRHHNRDGHRKHDQNVWRGLENSPAHRIKREHHYDFQRPRRGEHTRRRGHSDLGSPQEPFRRQRRSGRGPSLTSQISQGLLSQLKALCNLMTSSSDDTLQEQSYFNN